LKVEVRAARLYRFYREAKCVTADYPRKVRTPWAGTLGNTQGERSPERAIENETAFGQGWKGEGKSSPAVG